MSTLGLYSKKYITYNMVKSNKVKYILCGIKWGGFMVPRDDSFYLKAIFDS